MQGDIMINIKKRVGPNCKSVLPAEKVGRTSATSGKNESRAQSFELLI